MSACVWVCVCVCPSMSMIRGWKWDATVHIGDQMTLLWSLFYFILVFGIKLRSPGFYHKLLCPLIYLARPRVEISVFEKQVYPNVHRILRSQRLIEVGNFIWHVCFPHRKMSGNNSWAVLIMMLHLKENNFKALYCIIPC